MRSAGVRAIEAHQSVRKKAERLLEEMADLTPVHGVPVTEMSEDDSVVTSISAVIAAHTK